MGIILPQPDEAFDWVQLAAGAALICRPLARFADHFFTTRSWRLGSSTVESPAEGWDQVAASLGIDLSRLLRVHQVHGTAVVVHREGATRVTDLSTLPAADIIVGHDASHALAIQTADCVPLLIVDRRTGAVGAVHSGWRGLAARAPGVAVAALTWAFDSRPDALIAAVGPAIGPCCYEVGSDVRDRFSGAGFPAGQVDDWFSAVPRPTPVNPSMSALPVSSRAGHWFFDLWTSTRDQLERAGIPADQIFVAAVCTASHPATLCSYRRDGTGAGRLAGAIRALGNSKLRT